MAIRCKLISPTNLMLEHSMLSPVDETEFVVLGVKEWQRAKIDRWFEGIMVGALLMTLVASVMFRLYLG